MKLISIKWCTTHGSASSLCDAIRFIFVVLVLLKGLMDPRISTVLSVRRVGLSVHCFMCRPSVSVNKTQLEEVEKKLHLITSSWNPFIKYKHGPCFCLFPN